MIVDTFHGLTRKMFTAEAGGVLLKRYRPRAENTARKEETSMTTRGRTSEKYTVRAIGMES